MYRHGAHIFGLVIAAALMTVSLQGCLFDGRRSGAAQTTEEVSRVEGKLAVDAYLFDVKFKQNGKRRSVRLDVFFADTIALFTARGYLGKGVAKGVWRPDSSLFYFPTENQYYSGPLDEMTRAGCAGGGDLQRLVPMFLSGRLLSLLSAESSADSLVVINSQTDKKVEATVKLGTCETPVTLVFDFQSESPSNGRLYYLKEFSYIPDGGDSKVVGKNKAVGKDNVVGKNNVVGKSKVVGKRRILKRGKGLERRKFTINIPSDAKPVQW